MELPKGEPIPAATYTDTRPTAPGPRKSDQRQEDQQPERYQHKQKRLYAHVNFFDRITNGRGPTKYNTPGFYETIRQAVISPREKIEGFFLPGEGYHKATRAAQRIRASKHTTGTDTSAHEATQGHARHPITP